MTLWSARGYRRSTIRWWPMRAPVAALAGELPHLTAFPHWPPLEGCPHGLGRGRHRPGSPGGDGTRAAAPKTAILARSGDRPAGGCFVACQGCQAMLHALEVRPGLSAAGRGSASSARGGQLGGRSGLRYAVLAGDRRAMPRPVRFMQRAGMQEVGQYHYRRKPLSAVARARVRLLPAGRAFGLGRRPCPVEALDLTMPAPDRRAGKPGRADGQPVLADRAVRRWHRCRSAGWTARWTSAPGGWRRRGQST